jgi:hypothetical protein
MRGGPELTRNLTGEKANECRGELACIRIQANGHLPLVGHGVAISTFPNQFAERPSGNRPLPMSGPRRTQDGGSLAVAQEPTNPRFRAAQLKSASEAFRRSLSGTSSLGSPRQSYRTLSRSSAGDRRFDD